MKTSEFLYRRALPLAVVAGLGLTACGDREDGNTGNVAAPGAVSNQSPEGGVDTNITYYPNGTRMIHIGSMLGTDGGPIIVSEFCDGKDLVAVSEQDYYRGGAGGVEISQDHPACADGRLTQSDFVVSN